MLCIAVHRDSILLCVAGIDDCSLLTAVVSAGIAAGEGASFHVAGMVDLPHNRAAHVYWIPETRLLSTERLRFTLIESGEPSRPIELKATDSPKYLDEQRRFAEMERAWKPPTEALPVRWPDLRFQLKLKYDAALHFGMPLGHEHFLCSLHWNKWHPDECDVLARTYTGFTAGTEQRKTNCLRGKLKAGEAFELCVDA